MLLAFFNSSNDINTSSTMILNILAVIIMVIIMINISIIDINNMHY